MMPNQHWVKYYSERSPQEFCLLETAFKATLEQPSGTAPVKTTSRGCDSRAQNLAAPPSKAAFLHSKKPSLRVKKVVMGPWTCVALNSPLRTPCEVENDSEFDASAAFLR